MNNDSELKTEDQSSTEAELLPSASLAQNPMLSEAKFKPVLFSTDMVKAILEGRKTQTRRIIKEAKSWDINWKVVPIEEEHIDGIQRYKIRCGTQYHLPWFKAKFNVGDILWVRETFTDGFSDDQEYYYRADETNLDGFKNMGWKWKPSIFMPKAACRIFLEVTDVRVERLQDITEDDAIKEGIFFTDYGRTCYHNTMNGEIDKCPAPEKYHPQKNGWSYRETKSDDECLGTAKTVFINLWEKINGNWDENPFVWVIEFKIIDRPQGF